MATKRLRGQGDNVPLFDVPVGNDIHVATDSPSTDASSSRSGGPGSSRHLDSVDSTVSNHSHSSTRSVPASANMEIVEADQERDRSSTSPVITPRRPVSTLSPKPQSVRARTSKRMPGNASTHVQPSVLVQGDIFDLLENNGEVKGYRGVVASKIAGITYRQLDYWARKRILEPSINPSSGSGSRRLYSFKDILILAVSKRLLDTGVNLQNVTAAITFLNRQTVDALEHMTIICNGTSVRQCREDEQVLDLVEEGTAIFAVSVGKMWHEVDSALQDQPCVTVSSGAISEGLPTQPIEDLMERRMREKIETQRLERTKIA